MKFIILVILFVVLVGNIHEDILKLEERIKGLSLDIAELCLELENK